MTKTHYPPFTVVVSTVGTSLLTNGAESDLQALLRKTANFREKDFDAEERQQLTAHIAERQQQLRDGELEQVRRMSAELNAILALDALGNSYHHYLLHTDTLQGAATAEMVREWLQNRGVASANLVCLEGLTTARQEDFDAGMDSLLNWCHETLPVCREQGAHIVFNLVGGFKSFQAYAQTLGMLYSDESVYLFEAKEATLLRIPRIPLQFDAKPLGDNAPLFARLVYGQATVPIAEVITVPAVYLERSEGHAGISYWGKVAWYQVADSVLSEHLLEHPGISYADSFRKDFEKNAHLRVAVQQTIAKVAVLWGERGLEKLRQDGGIQYETYKNADGIGHFRLNQGDRVSAEVRGDLLILRHLGGHDTVNNNP